MTITTDLSKFGFRELKMLELLLTAMREQGLPVNFNATEVVPTFNMDSGEVFLANEDYEVCMINRETNKLEKWHHCSNCGHEGFADDFEHEPTDKECVEQMEWAGIQLNEESK